MSYSGTVDIRRGSSIIPKLGTPYFILTNYQRESSVYCCEIFILIPRLPESVSRNRITAKAENLPDVDPATIPEILKDEMLSWGQFKIEETIDKALPEEHRGHYYNLTLSQSADRSVLYRLLFNGGLSLAGNEVLGKSECKELQGIAKIIRHLSSNPMKLEEI